jgi:hypothetical protein
MSIATVLRVFKNSSLITEQGEFTITRIFPTGKAARKAGYTHHHTGNGIAVYVNHHRKSAARFAVIDDNP